MCDPKTLTVVIPTYDRVELTNRAINSVSSRRPAEVGIVVVDDCGSIPYEFAAKLNIHGISVMVLRTPFNGGPGLARRYGVERCSGRAVALLVSDDVYHEGWLDEGLDQLMKYRAETGGIFIAGRVQHGSAATRLVYSLLAAIPATCRVPISRLAVVMFNPFYTPSVILSRELCEFSDSLRYCEDYYTNAMALFRAKRVVLSRRSSCSLSRRPGSDQGESANSEEMLRGELSARWAMLLSNEVPLAYKLLVPLGVVYQFTRTFLKWFLGGWRRKKPYFFDAAT